MGGTAGEMDEVRPPRRRRADHQVDLGTLAQHDARFVGPGCEDSVDARNATQPREELRGVVDGGEQIDVADRRAPAAQRPGGFDPEHARGLPQPRYQTRDQLIGVVQQQARAAVIDTRDPLQDALLGPRREALEALQLSLLRGRPELLDRADAQLVVQQLDGARPDALDAEHVEQPGGHLPTQPLVVLEVSGFGELRELGAQSRTGAGNARRLARSRQTGSRVRRRRRQLPGITRR